MGKKHKKTNALRKLEVYHIPYEIYEYEWSEEASAGVDVAEKLNVPAHRVFKTLVGKGSTTGYVVFVIPVEASLDMKEAARVSGNKSVELIAVKDLLGITGYLRGGCSPVGMKKDFPTYFHVSMKDDDHVYVSAGLRGMQMKVHPVQLAELVNATFCEMIKEPYGE